jgi:hypothetical protein
MIEARGGKTAARGGIRAKGAARVLSGNTKKWRRRK